MITIDINTIPHRLARRIIIAVCAKAILESDVYGAICERSSGTYTEIYILRTSASRERISALFVPKVRHESVFRFLFNTSSASSRRDQWLDKISHNIASRYAAIIRRETEIAQDGEFVTSILKEK